MTRGYGGDIKGPELLTSKHTTQNAGDEALLLARKAPTIIAKNRVDGARFAENAGYDMIVLDDGLQNPSLEKTLSFITVNANYGFGNRQLIPAGPLREPLRAGLEKVSAIIAIDGDLAHTDMHKLLLRATIQVCDQWRDSKQDKETPHVAFTGLALPEKFRVTLKKEHLNIADFIDYPDHYAYKDSDLKSLKQTAQKHGARLVTTEKDAVRLPEKFIKDNNVDIVPITLMFENRTELLKILKTLNTKSK